MDALLVQAQDEPEDSALLRAYEDVEQEHYLREWRERHEREPHGWAWLAARLRRRRPLGR